MDIVLYFLYILIILLAVLFVWPSLFTSLSEQFLRKKTEKDTGDMPIPDLGLALKNDRTRAEFARRKSIKKTEKSVKLKTSQDSQATVPSDSVATMEKKSESPKVSIHKIIVPTHVEQGQKDLAVTLIVKNTGTVPLELVSVQLQFQAQAEDVSSQYVVRAKAGNPRFLHPGKLEELFLTVDVHSQATLGKTAMIPALYARIDDIVENVQISTTQILQWIVEVAGRTFAIATENEGFEKAGAKFGLQIQTHLNEQPDVTYDGKRRIYFSLESSPAMTSAEIPTYLDLVFEQGKAQTEAVFCLYNIVETYVICANDLNPGGGSGLSAPIELSPADLGCFQLHISSPQTHNKPFTEQNTLTAIDIYNNVKIDYCESAKITCVPEGEIVGLDGLGNALDGSRFVQGIASLEGMTLTLSDISEEGKMVKFLAKAGDKIGYSESVTILSQSPMSPSATQATIRKLLEYQKKKIAVANCSKAQEQLLSSNLQNEYEILSMELDTETVAAKLTESQCDILFLDAGTAMAGYHILRKIRRIPSLECLPILFLGSPSASEKEISEVLQSSSVYLTKPINVAAIRAIISDILEKVSLGRGTLPPRGARLPGSEGTMYQIVCKIGEGGMGHIYEARRLRDQKRVVIKYLPPRELNNIKSIVRFVQEAETVLQFKGDNPEHENLVAGYDVFLDRNRCFYVMEFIEGQTIEQILRAEGKLEPARATRIILQVAKALQALQINNQKLVHRDIKPANIIITPEGLVKLVDFGIAKWESKDPNLTTMGIILGTPYYLSPEQILGKEVTIQSDIYSLGATFYHITTGELPFQGQDVYSIIHQRLSRVPRDPRHFNPAIPRAIAEIIVRMMHRKPNKRYESLQLLIEHLDTVLKCIDSSSLALEEEAPLTSLQEQEQENQEQENFDSF